MLTAMIDASTSALSVTIALVLTHAAISKLRARERMIAVLQEFVGVPARWAPAAYAAVSAVESSLAAALVWPSTRRAGAAFATVLWICYTCLLLRAVASGRRVDCGCHFGIRAAATDHTQAAMRAMTLVIAAGAVALSDPSSPAVNLHLILDLAAGVTFFTLYNAWAQLAEGLRPIGES